LSNQKGRIFRPGIDKLESIVKERPYAAQMLQLQILYDMAGMLEDISESLAHFRSEFRSTIPKGYVEPIELTVTDKISKITKNKYATMPWISFDLFNDGPNPVYVVVNRNFVTRRAPLNSGESLTVDMKAPIIEKIYLFCDKGNTASVRIYAKR